MIGSLVLTPGVVILFFQKIKRLHTTPIADSGGTVEPRTEGEVDIPTRAYPLISDASATGNEDL